MKERVLILSKTHMNNNQVCVGGMTLQGLYVRLLDANGKNQPVGTNFIPRHSWKIEFSIRKNCMPPHIEDVLVKSITNEKKLKDHLSMLDFINKRNIPIWRGSPDQLFDNLIQWTQSGSGYIDKIGGIPNHSVGFWLSDKDLTRRDYNGVRYQYPNMSGWRSIKFKGFEEPVDLIPSGTLMRVSLARWFSRNDDEDQKCWLQLSGWYDL